MTDELTKLQSDELTKIQSIGLEKIKRSTISDANNRISYQVYEQLFYSFLTKLEGNGYQSKKFRFKTPLYAMDASVIDLCLSVFEWAKFRRTKGGLKLHSLFDIKSQLPAFNVITEAKEAEVTVAKNTAFPLSPDSIITFDRA